MGNHYYYEADNDVLWDGKGCLGSEASGRTIQNNIDMRVHDNQGYNDEAVPIDFHYNTCSLKS